MPAATRGLGLVALVLVVGVACEARPVPTASPEPSRLPAASRAQPTTPATPEPTARPMPSFSPDPLTTVLTWPEVAGPLQVAIDDRSGIVVGIEPLAEPDVALREGISPAPPSRRGVVYTWMGGRCDAWVLLTFESLASGLRLTAVTERRATPCLASGHLRQILIWTAREVDPASVLVVEGGYVPEPSEPPLATMAPWPSESALPPGTTAFDVREPGIGGRQPLDVRLIDETGLVTGLKVIPPVPGVALQAVPSPEPGLIYAESFSSCIDRLRMTLHRLPDGDYELRQEVAARSDVCFGLDSYGRFLFIQLRVPIPRDRIELVWVTE